jgi:hypothetical protein
MELEQIGTWNMSWIELRRIYENDEGHPGFIMTAFFEQLNTS